MAGSMQVLKAPQLQDGAEVTMNNQTSRLMTIDRSFSWSGSVGGPSFPGFPSNIVAKGSTKFTHLGVAPSGSKAVVIYHGFGNGNVPIAWVFAWDVPTDPTVSPNKVYATSAPKSIIDTITFDLILAALDNSVGSADASIESTTPNFVKIAANFSAN